MNHDQALDYLNHLAQFGSRLGLERMRMLLEELGNPHQELRIIHVAGTNGKGSVCACLGSILAFAGCRVGIYTSPHLVSFSERITINGQPIAADDLARCLSLVREAAGRVTGSDGENPTQFEVGTAATYIYFQEQNTDYVIQEVGLGGRLDATNVVDSPLLSIITPVSLDHTRVLGENLATIAGEKAGILKPDRPLVLGPQEAEAEEAIMARARELGCPVLIVGPGSGVGNGTARARYTTLEIGEDGGCFDFHGPGDARSIDNVRISLLGQHQVANAAVALAAACFPGLPALDEAVIRRGLETASWPGRLETVRTRPRVVLDGAHNPAGCQALARAVAHIWPGKKPILIFGAQNEKDWGAMLDSLACLNPRIIFTRVPWGQSLDIEKARARFPGALARPELESAVTAALDMADPDDIILIAGSLYMVGPARDLLVRDVV